MIFAKSLGALIKFVLTLALPYLKIQVDMEFVVGAHLKITPPGRRDHASANKVCIYLSAGGFLSPRLKIAMMNYPAFNPYAAGG